MEGVDIAEKLLNHTMGSIGNRADRIVSAVAGGATWSRPSRAWSRSGRELST
jgi:hypothetical protein